MSQVKRYAFIPDYVYGHNKWSQVCSESEGTVYVELRDLDRVTAERDAYKARELQSRTDLAKSLADHFRKNAEISALQQRLTAADERADKNATLAVGLAAEKHAMGERVDVLAHLLREGLEEYKDGDDWIERVIAALKPAEVGADSCEFCKGWGFRSNPDGADEGCGACNGTGKEPSDDQQ